MKLDVKPIQFGFIINVEFPIVNSWELETNSIRKKPNPISVFLPSKIMFIKYFSIEKDFLRILKIIICFVIKRLTLAEKICQNYIPYTTHNIADSSYKCSLKRDANNKIISKYFNSPQASALFPFH